MSVPNEAPRKDPETVVERNAPERPEKGSGELHGPRVPPTEAENGAKRDVPVKHGL